MKNKIISLLLALALLIPCILALTACGYVNIDGQYMAEVVGTYKMTSCKRHSTAEEDAEEPEYDLMAREEMTTYAIIKDDGFGYIVHRDKTRGLISTEMRLTYEYEKDEEAEEGEEKPAPEPDGEKRVTYVNFYYNDWQSKPDIKLGVSNKYKELMGGKTTAKKGQLYPPLYQDNFVYKKLSSATDLSEVKKDLGDDGLTYVPYALHGVHSSEATNGYRTSYYWAASSVEEIDNVGYGYYYFELDFMTKTANVWSVSGRTEEHVERVLPFTYEMQEGKLASISMDEKTFLFNAEANNFSVTLGGQTVQPSCYLTYENENSMSTVAIILDGAKWYYNYLLHGEEASDVNG